MEDLDVLLRLVIAHLLADFVFQTDKINKGKQEGIRAGFFQLHILIVGVTAYVLVGQWTQWLLPSLIMIVHGGIDWLKVTMSKRFSQLWLYLGDQLLHVLSLVALWYAFYLAPLGGAEEYFSGVFSEPKVLIVVIAFLVVSWPSGYLIGFMTEGWKKKVDGSKKSLRKAGETIGVIERVLILVFILIDEWSAIGFLLAAKSVFRFGDLNTKKARRNTEYILIGTILSFAFSVVLGLFTLFLIGMF
ncbi:MAG: DUF3307 domain-containing protein [Cyclobacteriaceae bacterium]